MGWMTIPQSSHLPESTPIIRNAHMSRYEVACDTWAIFEDHSPKNIFLFAFFRRSSPETMDMFHPKDRGSQKKIIQSEVGRMRRWTYRRGKPWVNPQIPWCCGLNWKTSFWDVFGFQHEIILILMWNVEAKVKEMNKFSNPSNLSRSPY